MSDLVKFMQTFQAVAFRYGHQFKLSVENLDSGTEERFSLQAESADLPGFTSDAVVTTFQGMECRFPGVKKWDGAWEVTCKCASDMKLYDEVVKWSNEFSNLELGGGGNKKLPTNRAYVDLYADDMTTIVKTFIIEGIFITGIGALSLSQSESEVLNFTVSFGYQYSYDEALGNPVK